MPSRKIFASFAKAGVEAVTAAIKAAASNEGKVFIGAHSVVKTVMGRTRLHGTSAKCHQTGPFYLS
jgi:translation initiation factor 2B subunit (eIF-2B alpha/beta/delta family)